MNTELIKKRFGELEGTMAQVGIGSNQMGRWVRAEPFHEWSTSVLNLLAMAFGPHSAHLKNFRALYDEFTGGVDQLEAARGIFRAAKSIFWADTWFPSRHLSRLRFLATSYPSRNRR